MENHNLNIQSYSLSEILGLFDIPSAYQISQEDLKRARKKVLMLHPDKSKLTPEYFLFYKKAFDVIIQFYNSQNRQNQKIDENTTNYHPENTIDNNKSTAQQINKTISKMSSGDFNNKFNNLFESNQMVDRPDPTRNEWFTSETATVTMPERQSVSSKNMGQAFDTIKKQTSGLVRYSGVQEMWSGSNIGGSSLYDDDQDTNDNSNNSSNSNNISNGYITSDPFSKLKYDDLRKVHKDQTVFAVSETDFDKMPKYQSVDHFNREREQQSMEPLAKEQAQQLLQDRERLTKERMIRKEYDANLRTQQYADKNKSVLASFLYLGNG